MAQKEKSYGYCYDKQGNLKEVSAPVNSNLQPIDKHSKTHTGALGANVGFPGGKRN